MNASIASKGASPAQVGFKLLVWLEGRTVGSVVGGVCGRPTPGGIVVDSGNRSNWSK